jgi:hypothetical protein
MKRAGNTIKSEDHGGDAAAGNVISITVAGCLKQSGSIAARKTSDLVPHCLDAKHEIIFGR